MLFHSLQFLLFLPVIFAIYWSISTHRRLRQWLLDPQAMVPGNRMIYSNGMSDAELSALIDYLTITP